MSTTSAALTVAIAALAGQAVGQNQWKLQSPLPLGDRFETVSMRSPTHWWAMGRDRTIRETTNGGASWTTRHAGPGSASGNAAYGAALFTDDLHGYALPGGSGLTDCWRTADGGLTWQPMSNFPLGSVNDMDFITATTGFAGLNGAVGWTGDGGATWQLRAGYPDCPIIFGFDFRDQNVGLAGGIRSTPHNDEAIYRTTNGGATWMVVHPHSVNDVKWLDANTAIAIDGTDIIRSTDEGQTWSVYAPGITTGLCEFARVGTGDVICGVSMSGHVWRSPDRGATWTMVLDGIGTLPELWNIDFPSPSFGVVTGPEGEFFTSADGGLTWTMVNNGIADQIMDLKMFDSQYGLAVTDNMYVLRTRDGGNRWDTQKLRVTGLIFGRDEYLSAVSVVDDQFAVVAGDGGVAFRTLNGGDTWENVGWPGGGINQVYTAFDTVFIDRDNGWIAGYGPGGHDSVYRTQNGGLTWTPHPSLTGLYTSIDFKGQRGWLGCNQSPFVFRTTDGGQNWQLTPIPPDFIADARVKFFDQNIGWIVGFYGYMGRSTDGGATWTQLPKRSQDENYLNVKPVSATEAYIVGQDRIGPSFLLHTTDAGAHWTRENLTGFYGLSSYNAIDARPSGQIWLGGFDGRIAANNPAPLRIVLPSNAPTVVAPGVTTTIDVEVYAGSQQVIAGTPMLWHRNTPTTSFTAAPMSYLGGSDYRATLPAFACTDTAQFYFSAQGSGGATVTLPVSAPAAFYSASVGFYQNLPIFSTDFTGGLPAGWSATGLWHGSTGCAPASGSCGSGGWAYYGQEATCNYDTGTPNSGSLSTPPILLPQVSGAQTITLSFCNALITENGPNTISDFDIAEVWANDTWFLGHVFDSTSWTNLSFDLTPLAGQSVRIQWKYRTNGDSANNFRGWHVDTVRVTAPVLVCQTCYANCDGSTAVPTLNIQDFACFLSRFASQDPYANCDGSTAVPVLNVQDFSCFLNRFSTGCP